MESHSLTGLFADRYEIERPLGRGASATVYLAQDTKQDRQIALKVLDHELAHAIGAKRFLQEIHITSRLQHPHILPIHDSGEWQGLLYYVLPFVAGESLRARMDREKQLPIEDCERITCDVALALAHAHSTGVIHRDVKPENILLSDGHALIADFGIARSTHAVASERLTSSGLIVGTSQYMSPEQASGEREIDARSDIYSLGCVLYEMLAGVEPFSGPNVQAIIAQRFTHAPRPVSTFRPSVPEGLERALNRALAISPADRFQSMKDFAAALPATTGSPTDRRRRGRSFRDTVRTRRGKILSAAALIVIVTVTAATISGRERIATLIATAPQLDSAKYIVLPFLDERGTVSQASETSADIFYRALKQWNGINVVSDLLVSDALSRSGKPAVISDALKRARNLGAGKLIWGTVTTTGGRVQLFDVNSGAGVREVEYLPAQTSPESTLVRLFRDPSWPANADGGTGRTKSFAAWQAYGRAHMYLGKWNLEAALGEFDRAARLDNGFVPARLWSAQLRSWKPNKPDADSVAWVRDARFAAAHATGLAPKDQLLALALGDLAAGNFSSACNDYRKVIRVDSTDFTGWHGLGKCEILDERVFRDSRSPSGWQFRSSYSDAAINLMRAVQLDPGAHAIVTFGAMQKPLVTSPSRIRIGLDSTSGTRFAAYPTIIRDTLAYVPYPLTAFASLTTRGRNDALDRNARSLFAFTKSWTESDRNNPEAWEAMASVLETMGSIDTRSPEGMRASNAIAKSLALTTDPGARVRLAAMEARLRVKRGEFALANRLADSLLRNTSDTVGTAELLNLAAITGRTESMIRLAQLHSGWLPMAAKQYTLMPDLVATTAELFSRAALGECGENISRLIRTIDNQIESYVSADKRPAVRQILMARTYSMLSPCTGAVSSLQIPVPENLLYRLQRAFARNRKTEVRAILDTMVSNRASSRAGDLSTDYTYQEAWIRNAIGDTAGAVKQLDLALSALPAVSASTLAQPAAGAAVARIMILRADLAVKSGDAVTARRWAKAASDLWTGASLTLHPELARMKILAAAAQK